MSIPTRRSWSFRAAAWILVPGQVLIWIPTVATAAPAAEPARLAASIAEPVAPEPDPSPAVAPPVRPVSVNRTVPRVTPPPLFPTFSAMPTQAEITRARVFQEPLLPVHGIPTAEQNLALSRVLTTYLNGGGGENTAPIEAILEAHSLGPWQASLLLNVGIVYLRTGRPSRALRVFAEAWALASTATDADSKAVADMAIGQWAQVLARVGKVTELQKVLAEVEGRTIGGTAGELLQQGREGAQRWRHSPTAPSAAAR